MQTIDADAHVIECEKTRIIWKARTSAIGLCRSPSTCRWARRKILDHRRAVDRRA